MVWRLLMLVALGDENSGWGQLLTNKESAVHAC